MESLYFKYKHSYLNGTSAKDYTYIRIAKTGKVTVVSMSKRTIGNPRTLSLIQENLSESNKEEFNKFFNEIFNN